VSNYSKIKARLNLRTTKLVDYACRFLESRGWRFCVDFGVKNAVEKASQVALAELDPGAPEVQR
jgi:hypothetical protein